jgi:PncC family amidohydrolase
MSLRQDVVDKLSFKNWTVSFAESCTGGLISSQLTELPGVSKVYKGSVVSYSNQAKSDVLGVPEKDLQDHGAVSSVVAIKMAKGAKSVLKTSVALSVTGVAGPTGGSDEKPVGLVYIAVVGPDFEKVERHLFTGSNGEQLSRHEIQLESSKKAWELLSGFL